MRETVRARPATPGRSSLEHVVAGIPCSGKQHKRGIGIRNFQTHSRATARVASARFRFLGGEWQRFHGQRHLVAPAAATAKAKAAPKAAAAAAKAHAAPKALPKAAPRPPKQPWSDFKNRLTWKQRGSQRIAGVKQFLNQAKKPATNTRKAVNAWRSSLLRTRLQGQHFYDVDRNYFTREGSRPGGGSKMPAASETALEMVYSTY